MTKIYVAGKNLERAHRVMCMLRDNGHTITFDWLIGIENKFEQNVEKAIQELEAIRDCDILVYLWEEDQESARYEAGMAMGLGKKIIVSGNHKSFFLLLPGISSVSEDNQILSVLQ